MGLAAWQSNLRCPGQPSLEIFAAAERVKISIILALIGVVVAGFHGLTQKFHGAFGVLLFVVRDLAARDGVDAGSPES